MRILGIETSCDETGVAVYDSEQGIVAEKLYSQINLHRKFGGVIPELASRDHAKRLTQMTRDMLKEGGMRISDMDAIAYTSGPGLIGALMVGSAFANSLSLRHGLNIIPIHHMEGHLLAPLIENKNIKFPFLALLVSGGHTLLVHVVSYRDYRIVGQTIDDAVGECFDKVARMLGLDYPGGPAIDINARGGDRKAFKFPRPMLRQSLDFSFSGLKTAVKYEIQKHSQEAIKDKGLMSDICASFQEAAVETLVYKCRQACKQLGVTQLVMAGGVAANSRLREMISGMDEKVEVFFPSPKLCTDNGSMIAFAGYMRLQHDFLRQPIPSPRPRWSLEELTYEDA